MERCPCALCYIRGQISPCGHKKFALALVDGGWRAFACIEDSLKDCMAVSIPPGLGSMRAIGGFLPLSPAFILSFRS